MRIIITGPRSVGKSTVARILAKKTGLQYISSDELGEEAMKEIGGLDKAIKSGKIHEFIEKKGYSIILSVFEKDNFVFDLSGGSISSRSHVEASEEIRDAAKKSSFVIGLLPSPNSEKSARFLYEREKERKHFKGTGKDELLENTKKDFSKYPELFDKFCDAVIYVEGKTPDEIVQEIIEKWIGGKR